MNDDINVEIISDALHRLGFYFVECMTEVDETTFHAGHVSGYLIFVLGLNKKGSLTGPYSALVENLLKARDRYESESQDVIVLHPQDRVNWLKDLAKQAGVTVPQLSVFVRTR